MAIYFMTTVAQDLLTAFNARISQSEAKGKITTWERSKDGVFYTHKATDWHAKAWFKPTVQNDRLTFHIVKPEGVNITTLVYAYYHGHLAETFLSHFDSMFSISSSTAMPIAGDLVK